MREGKKLVGKIAVIKDGWYKGDYGYIIAFDGDVYHISGGSFSYSGSITPVFDREQFLIPKNQEKFRVQSKMGSFEDFCKRL